MKEGKVGGLGIDTDRKTGRQTDRQTDRARDRQTEELAAVTDDSQMTDSSFLSELFCF